MSSYFDFFCQNVENVRHQKEESIKGDCYSMCPNDEVKMREREHLVHVLEVLGPVRRLVKSYRRTAADANMAVPRLLRPYPVLKDTVNYLLLEVTRRVDVPTSVVYDFMNDRLRAVRQDMTIQRLPPGECACLLEPMIRFYVFFGYRLSHLPLKDFEPVLNKKYLLECVKWFLSCCDSIPPTKVESLSTVFSNLDLNKNKQENGQLVCDRVLVECLYILCNLDDIHPLFRYIGLPKAFKGEPRLKLAYEIAIANMQGKYVRVCKLMDKLCVLTYCAVCVYLPTMQRRALQVLSHAYSSKRLSVPTEVVAQWLRFADGAEAAAACAHYGLTARDGVRFDKGEFRGDVDLHKIKIQDLKAIFNVNIEDVFTYSYTK